jgi:hypothetical protein
MAPHRRTTGQHPRRQTPLDPLERHHQRCHPLNF